MSLGISVIGWYLIATGAFGFLALLPLRRRPVTMHYGFVFTGWQAIVTNVLYSAISFYLGTSLLRRKRQGPQLAIYYGLFLLLDICVFLFRPDREARVDAYNTEEDLIDQLFNSSEKRLARALLLLARYGTPNQALTLPKVSQTVLAEMVGTTRTRVNFFMNKFKKLGFIEYEDGLKINNSLLSVVLRD
jgi:hypothetical protein